MHQASAARLALAAAPQAFRINPRRLELLARLLLPVQREAMLEPSPQQRVAAAPATRMPVRLAAPAGHVLEFLAPDSSSESYAQHDAQKILPRETNT